MKIGEREIGIGEPPYIVADLSASHNGDIQRGISLINYAKQCGADAVKFQAYLPETVSCDADRPEFVIQQGPWAGERLFDLYTRAHTPRHFLKAFFEHAKSIGITAFSTACSEEDVDFLETLGNPVIKIASMDIVNIPLIEHAAGKGKPLIISTGMASSVEIDEADAAIWLGGEKPEAAFLHCVSAYPCPLAEANLGGLARLKALVGATVGYSDHTLGHTAAVMATALGAVMIEKHLTLSRLGDGPDDHFASEPHEFKRMVAAVRDAHAAMTPWVPAQDVHRPLRPSLHAVADIQVGSELTRENVRAIRPGGGLSPDQLPGVLGKYAFRDIAKGEALNWSMIEG